MEKNPSLDKLKIINMFMLADPLILLFVAVFMKRSLSYQPSPEFYEINQTMRIIQYFLYLSGLAVFFFMDGIIQILRKKIFVQAQTNPIAFNILGIAVVDYISIAGFLGFLISGNIAWVTTFCLISFFSRFRFLPLNRNISRFTTGNIESR
ncbi:MAG TPA: hypothetical protein PKW86_09035 [bacterium]|nr:hypothetical protein [bacterium]HOL35999.1 hypothetical protein [bacterium]